MKVFWVFALSLAAAPGLADIVTVELDQDISLADTSPDENFAQFNLYTWVGTNFAGATQQSLYGFDLSDVSVTAEEIVNLSFGAYIPLRHGPGGEVHAAIGPDNDWDQNTATFSSHGDSFGERQDTQLLTNDNLNQWFFWDLDTNLFADALAEDYLTVYLYTTEVGADGTNFHDVAGLDYQSGNFTPYLSIETVSVPEPSIFSLFLIGLLGTLVRATDSNHRFM